jgi:hypothetical protein
MQIYVKHPTTGEQTIVQLESNIFDEECVNLIFDKLKINSIEARDSLGLVLNKKFVPLNSELKNNEFYELKVRNIHQPTIDAAVMNLLVSVLTGYINHPPSGTFILVSIGCLLNTDPGLEGAKNQQCPESVVSFCASENLKLIVILVDRFIPGIQAKQIYNYDKAWIKQSEECHGKIVHYKYASTNVLLSTYATHLTEWSKGMTTIETANLHSLGQKLEEQGGYFLVRSWNGDVFYHSSEIISKLGSYS